MIDLKYAYVVIVFLLVTLPSCSSTKEPKSEEFFRTEIRDDNSKEFSFSLIFSHNGEGLGRKTERTATTQKRDKGNGKGRSKGKGQGKENKSQDVSATDKTKSKIASKPDKLQAIFQEQLALKMQDSQYCRTGYLTLEKNFIGAIYTLRGECNESATKEDKNQHNIGSD